MTLEEMYQKLRDNAYDDFNDMLQNTNFLDGDTIELSHKISLAKTMADYVIGNMSYGVSDIPTMLYYDKPITNFCEWYENKGLDMFCDLYDEISEYITKIKTEIKEVVQNPQNYDREVQNHASYIYSLIEIAKEIDIDDYCADPSVEDEWER